MNKLYIVMPAYNEADNIEEVVSQWYPVAERIVREGSDCRIVVANDGSKDSTYEILLKLQDNHNLLIPIDKPNSGHGATILFLYHYAIDHGADYIFQTDSDGQTLPNEFWQMWNNRDKYDFQIGVRGRRQDGVRRILVTKTLRLVVRVLFHVWVKDANTPFRLMRSNMLKPILDIIPQGYNLANVAVSAIAVKWNYKIGWYPISFRPRQGGVNSINMKSIYKIGVNALRDFKAINRSLNNNE